MNTNVAEINNITVFVTKSKTDGMGKNIKFYLSLRPFWPKLTDVTNSPSVFSLLPSKPEILCFEQEH